MSTDKRIRQCAIYTRKSSEEGLEQAFNSLDAQREACEAYIQSQKHEGWRPVRVQYDDGGFSGGNMERPALKQLMEDIIAGKVQVVVVYKVDRLTRSLADFAKVIDLFDTHGVSFISVTQQFNTTTSMGRLTLNVLLSFAQFEREVTGERIRDKIAASKKKGLWMGGNLPLGYDSVDRRLVVNPEEAATVHLIFELYMELESVRALQTKLKDRGIVSKRRVFKTGCIVGGTPLSRGALYHLLQNRVYIGEITHKKTSYPGQHEAIVSRELWEQVQAQIAGNRQGDTGAMTTGPKALLSGILFDAAGRRLTPNHANKLGRRYLYYVTSRTGGEDRDIAGSAIRLPAREIENAVLRALGTFLEDEQRLLVALVSDGENIDRSNALVDAAKRKAIAIKESPSSLTREVLRSFVERIELGDSSLTLNLSRSGMQAWLDGLPDTANADANSKGSFQMEVPISRRRRGVERILIIDGSDSATSAPDPALLKLVGRAYVWNREYQVAGKSMQQIATEAGVGLAFVSRIIQLAFLAPDIIETIVEGRQPVALTAERLKRLPNLPSAWEEQRCLLGFN